MHEPGNPLAFIGLLLIKKVIRKHNNFSFCNLPIGSCKLLNYDPSQALPVSSFSLSILPEALPSVNCFQALDYL